MAFKSNPNKLYRMVKDHRFGKEPSPFTSANTEKGEFEKDPVPFLKQSIEEASRKARKDWGDAAALAASC